MWRPSTRRFPTRNRSRRRCCPARTRSSRPCGRRSGADLERYAHAVAAARGGEQAFGEALAGEPLGDMCARAEIEELTVLAAGSSWVFHYEASRGDAVADFVTSLDSARLLGDPSPDGLFGEIFAWETSEQRGAIERAALLLTLQEGKEQEYRDWLASGVLPTLETIWKRNRIWRHDVLASGTRLIAYYECESRFNVLKAFREPEALVMLIGDLSKLMVLDPYVPFALHEQRFYWRAERE